MKIQKGRWVVGRLSGLLLVIGLLLLPVQNAQAIFITSDFADLFGAGSLATLPGSVASGSTTFSGVPGSGLSGIVEYAVWSLTSGGSVFVYDITNTGTKAISTFLVTNPLGPAPIALADLDGELTAFPSNLGFVNRRGDGDSTTATGSVEPGLAPLFASVSATGDLQWDFGFIGLGIPGGGESNRLYAAFDSTAVGVGEGWLIDGFPFVANGPVPAVPEPMSLVLLGFGMVGLSFLRWRNRLRS